MGISGLRVYVECTSKVFQAGGQSVPEGIRIILSRPSGKERILGEKKVVLQYGPQDARHCFWHILGRDLLCLFFFREII